MRHTQMCFDMQSEQKKTKKEKKKEKELPKIIWVVFQAAMISEDVFFLILVT